MQALLRLAIIDRSGHRLEWRCSLPPPPACGCHRCCRANRCDPPLQPSNQRLIVTSLIFIPPLPPGSAPMRRRSPSRFHYRTLSPCPCPPHQPSMASSVDCFFLLAIAHAASLSTLTLSRWLVIVRHLCLNVVINYYVFGRWISANVVISPKRFRNHNHLYDENDM